MILFDEKKSLLENAYFFAGIVLVIGLIFSYFTYRRSKKTERARFLLDLREAFWKFRDVNANLRPGGLWDAGNINPVYIDEASWLLIEAYMGQFELCYIMIRDNLISKKDFADQYEYRIINIMSNAQIVQAKLVAERESWEKFILLYCMIVTSARVDLCKAEIKLAGI